MVDHRHDRTDGESGEGAHSSSSSELADRVAGEIGSLRSELSEIRDMLMRGHSLDRAMEEYRYVPGSNGFRWGFAGAWDGGRNSAHSIYTTSSTKEFFDHPDAAPEHVAALAGALSSPHTVAVCVHLFRHGDTSREALQQELALTAPELEAAVGPLLEWRFVRWDGDTLTRHGPDLCNQGLNIVVTVVGVARHAWAVKNGRTADGRPRGG